MKEFFRNTWYNSLVTKQYNYILLDWDGNIAKTLHLWLDVFREILAEEGFHPSDKEIAGSFGLVTKYFESLGIKNAGDVYDRANERGKARLPEVELYPDALEVLSHLKSAGKKTALITSSRRENVEMLLNKYGIHYLFDTIVARFETEHHKPHPEIAEKALSLLGGTKDQAVIIGDSDKDIQLGTNAGIDTILFYPPEHEVFYDLAGLRSLSPTYTIHDFRAVITLV